MNRLNISRSGVSVLICCLFAAGEGALAQNNAPPLDADVTNMEPVASIAPRSPQPEMVDKRLFGVIPNYRAGQAQADYKPISTHEKFLIAHSDSFDWPNYFLLAGYALQSQMASGGFKQNGGIGGFGEFYARGMADLVIGSYVTEAIMPSLLHEDPRFFRLGTGSFWHRAYYATSRIFVTRLDNGGARLNISEIAGNMGVIAVTTSYYPDSRSASEAAERYGMLLGNDAISNLLTEFWPDIKHRLSLLHRKT